MYFVIIIFSALLILKTGEEELIKRISMLGQTQFENAAVVTNSLACTTIALDVLSVEGTAVDAAIAAAVCEGISNPQSMGIGGGFIATLYKRGTITSTVLNAREMAPKAAHKDMFGPITDNDIAIGGLSVAVPGELRGYYELHQKFGKMSWFDLFQPAIKMCKEGTAVTAYTARIIAKLRSEIHKSPTLQAELTNELTGKLYVEGDLMRRTVLGDTLELVALKGPDVLYNGELTTEFIKDIQRNGGIITKEDLKLYKPQWQTVISQKVDKFTVYSSPPPSAGVLLTLVLQTISSVIKQGNPTVIWHRIVEVWKYAYGFRTQMTGPIMNTSGNSNVTAEAYKYDTSWITKVRDRLNDEHTSNDSAKYFGNYGTAIDGGTAHISILASNGDAVALTSTINLGFGSLLVSESTGIILNNQMMDFAIPNHHLWKLNPKNMIEPYKQPMSSMCPTIIVDSDTKNVILVIGASGGFKILSATTLACIRFFWFNDSLSKSIYSERLHHQLIPMVIEYEEGFPLDILKGLRAKGHELKILNTTRRHMNNVGLTVRAAVNGIAVKNGLIYAVPDPRRMAVGGGY